MDISLKVTIRLMDRERSCMREIGENSMLFIGDKIEIFTNEAEQKFYTAEIL